MPASSMAAEGDPAPPSTGVGGAAAAEDAGLAADRDDGSLRLNDEDPDETSGSSCLRSVIYEGVTINRQAAGFFLFGSL